MQNGDKIDDIYTRTITNSAKLDAVADDLHDVKTNHTGLVSFAKSNRLMVSVALILIIIGIVAYWALVYGRTILPENIAQGVFTTLIGVAVGVLMKRST